MEHFKDINLERIESARRRIDHLICQTPVIKSHHLSERLKKNVWLKLENLQPTGAFKLRGAANAILSLSDEQKLGGVVTMSTGNHGKAVAYVAKALGIKATICISKLVPSVKVEAMKLLGANVQVSGENQEEATEHALLLEKDKGMTYISAFDNPDVIAGQGTVALEILEQIPQVDTMIAPVSGGGLMSGMAFAAKSSKPNIKMVGVTNDQEPAIYTSIKAGHIVQVGESESLADALPGPINEDNEYTFEMCRRYVDEIMLVSEEGIARGLAHALLKEKQVLEGGGAASIALLLDKQAEDFGENVVAVCSGNSVSMELLLEIASRYKDQI